jgi:predicted secreted protein
MRLLLIVAFAAACGCAHFSEAAKAGQTCEVMRGNEVVHVVSDVAYLETWTSERKIVRYREADRIHRVGVIENEVGHFDGQRLVTASALQGDSDPIASGEVRLGAARFEYASACSPRDAALGTMALIVHEAS